MGKSLHPIVNWPQYNKSLINRESLTFWVDADGTYDTKACHAFIRHKGATACIPSRKNAGLWEEEHPRNDAVLVMHKEGLTHWKRASGYHRRSLAETAISRFK